MLDVLVDGDGDGVGEGDGVGLAEFCFIDGNRSDGSTVWPMSNYKREDKCEK